MNCRFDRRSFLKAAGLSLGAVFLKGCRGNAEVSQTNINRPNIILIMADDMGFSDIGCYGGEIETPNLDMLASNGVRFTQFSNTARCCPTRASLMTGLYPHQAGMGWMTAADLGYEGYHGDLNNKCVTIAEVLKEAGYSTYMAGKWHLTYEKYLDGPKHSWPCQRGFDRFYGTVRGGGCYYNPPTLTRDNQRIEAPDKGYYYTDAVSNAAIEFILDHDKNKGEKPFFIYTAHTAPHWPLHAPAETIRKYRGKYLKGWDKIRQERYKRLTEMGIINHEYPLTKRDKNAKAWELLNEEKKDDMDLRMAIYAAQVDHIDKGVGGIIDALKKTGRFENTLIVFLADNGGCAEYVSRGKGRIGTQESYESYRLPWANTSNTPFREYKHWVHEGGIATPLIAHWPKRIKDSGALREQAGHVVDIMATCVDVSGARYPSSYKGNMIRPMEGVSLTGAFDNKQILREAIYWEHEANCAIRKGKWKLVRKHNGSWELYDMEADRTETKDLSEEQPEMVEKLSVMWDRWAQENNVLPLDGRGWGERVRSEHKD